MIPLLDWCLAHWWLIFWLAIFGVFDWARDFVLGLVRAVAGTGERRHERRMEELELRARAAESSPAALPKPGRCVHRQVRAVVSVDDQVKAWLCRCGKQLPADWAVREEDL